MCGTTPFPHASGGALKPRNRRGHLLGGGLATRPSRWRGHGRGTGVPLGAGALVRACPRGGGVLARADGAPNGRRWGPQRHAIAWTTKWTLCEEPPNEGAREARVKNRSEIQKFYIL